MYCVYPGIWRSLFEAAKADAAEDREEAEALAELWHKSATVSNQTGYLASIFGVEASYMQGVLITY